MKKILFLLLLCMMTGTAGAQRKVSSGLLVSGGLGFDREAVEYGGYDMWGIFAGIYDYPLERYSSDYRGNLSLGYRFRIEPDKNPGFFWDIDLLLNAKFFKDVNCYCEEVAEYSYVPAFWTEAKTLRLSMAVSPSINYRILEHLYTGIGVEPTLYFAGKRIFDAPLVLKVGYQVGKLDFALTYRVGFTKVASNELVPYGKVSDLNLSVFIPFHVK